MERQYAYDDSEKEKIIAIGQREKKSSWRRQRWGEAQGAASNWECVHHIQGKRKDPTWQALYLKKSQGIKL